MCHTKTVVEVIRVGRGVGVDGLVEVVRVDGVVGVAGVVGLDGVVGVFRVVEVVRVALEKLAVISGGGCHEV